MFTLLNPSTFLDISVTYNKGLYKPAKNGNLTTWLFGSSKGFKSKILEGLEDWFEKMTFVEDGERKVRPDDYTHVSYEEEPLKNSRDSET
jgi:hypothetical protein